MDKENSYQIASCTLQMKFLPLTLQCILGIVEWLHHMCSVYLLSVDLACIKNGTVKGEKSMQENGWLMSNVDMSFLLGPVATLC